MANVGCDYGLLELGELRGGLGAAEAASDCWWAACLGTAQQPSCGQGATGQQSQGSQSCLSITSYKGLFELTGCWTHSISKVSKAANDGEPDREYVNEK